MFAASHGHSMTAAMRETAGRPAEPAKSAPSSPLRRALGSGSGGGGEGRPLKAASESLLSGPEKMAAARARAQELKRQQGAQQAEVMAQQAVMVTKRKLRAKIADIVIELRRREALRAQQDKNRKYLESLKGPDAENWGNHTSHAFGINPEVSPRRTHILDSLTLEELRLLKADLWFFFQGPAFQDKGRSPEENEAAVEDLMDFFTPSREELSETIEAYRARLLKELDAEDDWEDENEVAEDRTERVSNATLRRAAERMPCLGRRVKLPDEPSPTLERVKEARGRRDERDAEWVMDKVGSLMRKNAINAFKAREMKRERKMVAGVQTELQQLRTLEVERSRQSLEAKRKEKKRLLEAEAEMRHAAAELKAVEMIEHRRDEVTASLDAWARGVDRSQRYKSWEERQMQKKREDKFESTMSRINSVGEFKTRKEEKQSQKNDALKTGINKRLAEHLKQQQEERCDEILDKLEEKYEVAAAKRETKSRYGILQKAFGKEAYGFDSKLHAVDIDRRSEVWQRGMERISNPTTEWQRSTLAKARSLSEPLPRRPE